MDILAGSNSPDPEFRNALAASPFFHFLAQEWLDLLGGAAEQTRFAAGEVIQPAGSISPRLYLIARGEVELSRGEGGQDREIVGSAMPGAVFGAGPLTDEPELTSYRAAGEVEAWTWSRETFDHLRRTAPALTDQLRCRISILSRERELLRILGRSTVFCNTSPALLRRLLEAATLARFAARDTICRQGEEGECMFLVVQGEVEVVSAGPDGPAPQAIATLRRGDCFGEMSLLAHAPRNASVNALVDSEILIISKREFDFLYRSSASFRTSIQVLAQERLHSIRAEEMPEPVWLVTNSGIPPESLAGFLAEALSRGGARVLVLRIDDSAEAAPPARTAPGCEWDVVHPGSLTADAVMRRGFDYALCYDVRQQGGGARRVLRDLNPTVLFLTDNFARRLPGEIGAGQIVHYVQLLDSSKGRLDWGEPRRGALRAAIPFGALDKTRGVDELPDPARSFFHRLARLLARRRVGVALGGGGAWGWAHCALLKGLHRAGIPIDLITGASFGSIVGAFYASQGIAGLDCLIAAMSELSRAFLPALITTKPAERFLARHLAAGTLEELEIPFLPVAVDIRTGAEKVFRSGPIIESVLASCSFPGVLAPVVSGRVRYIDACFKNNVPASCLLEEGVDFAVASNVVPPPSVKLPASGETGMRGLLARLSPFSRVSDTLRSMQLLLSDMGSRQASLAAVTFAPDLSEFGMTEIKRGAEVIRRAEAQLPRFLEEAADCYRAACSANPHQRG